VGLDGELPKDPGDESGGAEGGGRSAPADLRSARMRRTAARPAHMPCSIARPGMEAKLCFIGHGLMENGSGLIVDVRLTSVSGHAERLAALDMIDGFADRTLCADKDRDSADVAGSCEPWMCARTRPVPQTADARRSRTTRHSGYGASRRIRKRNDQAFAWMNTVAGSGVDFDWHGFEVTNGGWVQLQSDGSLIDEFAHDTASNLPRKMRPWRLSSTACRGRGRFRLVSRWQH